MPRLLLPVLAALALSVPTLAVAAPGDQAGPKMKIVSFTGQIQIKVGNEVIGVVQGGTIPDIPAGAEIIIVSGEAVLQAGDTVVKADAGSSFAFTASDSGGVQIASTGEKAVAVNVGGAVATVEKGEKVEVAVAAAGKAEVKVVTGNVDVTVGGQTQTVAAGGSVAAPAAPPPAQAQTAQQTQQQQTSTTESQTATTESGSTSTTDTASAPPPPPPPNPSQDQQTVSPSSP